MKQASNNLPSRDRCMKFGGTSQIFEVVQLVLRTSGGKARLEAIRAGCQRPGPWQQLLPHLQPAGLTCGLHDPVSRILTITTLHMFCQFCFSGEPDSHGLSGVPSITPVPGRDGEMSEPQQCRPLPQSQQRHRSPWLSNPHPRCHLESSALWTYKEP